MPQSAPSKFGVIAIVSTAIVVLLIISLAFVSFFLEPAKPTNVESFTNATDALNVNNIDPALSVALLGGLSGQEIIEQAIKKARPDTGLALIMHSPTLNASDAVGDLLLLADKFSQKKDFSKAKLCLKMAGDLATLSPDLSDTLRADVFLQTGLGLTKLGDPILAKIYLDQAFLVATESSYLQTVYRQFILQQLHEAYLAINLKEAARHSLDLSLQPPKLEALPENPLALPLSKQVPLPTEVQTAENTRWQMAQAVVKDLVQLGGVVNPDTLNELQVALLNEDAAKTEFYNKAIEAEQQFSGKVDLTQAKINWLTIKYQIAQGAFGMSIVPTWEEEVEQIKLELSNSYQDLYQLYNDLIVAMPDASQIDRAIEEALRRQILAGELGHYPGYPASQLEADLLNATAKLVKTQPGTKLRVSYLSVNDLNYYTLISDKEILKQ